MSECARTTEMNLIYCYKIIVSYKYSNIYNNPKIHCVVIFIISITGHNYNMNKESR